MPYPRAHWLLLVLIPAIGVAFWPGYFSRLGASPLAHHVHGVTGSLWILLLVLQSWAIHNRRFALHRAAGRSSLLLFPQFMAGGLMALHAMATGFVAQAHPFYTLFGARLGLLDFIAMTAFAWLFYGALRHRGKVQLHARYMLATPLLLLAPIVSRLLTDFVPYFAIKGPEDMGVFFANLHLSNSVAIVAALLLYASSPRHGRPFLVVAGVALLQGAAFQWLAVTSGWQALFAAYAGVPLLLTAAAGLAAGLALVYAGWTGPRSAGRPPVPERAPS